MELELEQLLPVINKTVLRISEEIDKKGIVDVKILSEWNKAVNCRIRLEEFLSSKGAPGNDSQSLPDIEQLSDEEFLEIYENNPEKLYTDQDGNIAYYDMLFYVEPRLEQIKRKQKPKLVRRK